MKASSSSLAPRWLALIWLLLVVAGWFTAGEDWRLNHGILFMGGGLVLTLMRPDRALPPWVWPAVLILLGFSSLAFLPVDWFGVPAWRQRLYDLGLPIGGSVVVQSSAAIEYLVTFALALLAGLALTSLRLPNPRGIALAALWAITMYACVSRWNFVPDTGDTFGYFPNRNHSATLLAAGLMLAAGLLAQSLRERHWWTFRLAALPGVIVLYAVFMWSESRAGFFLPLIALALWFPLLGRGYLNRRIANVFSLVALFAVVVFTNTENPIAERLEDTSERIGEQINRQASDPAPPPGQDNIDFRIPTWLDSVEFIGQYPLTGVGSGQFRYIFPQYRKRTAVKDYSRSLHPESDWLWFAAEHGVPAALVLAALTCAYFGFGLRWVLRSRQRALRLACLLGAAVVAIHGLFDVPGHRIPIAWTAALLFAASLPKEAGPRRAKRWPYFLLGAISFACGSLLLLSLNGWIPAPAHLRSEIARAEAEMLSQRDQAQMKAAFAAGDETYEPEFDFLQQAEQGLQRAAEIMPLDPELWRMRGLLALQYDDQQPKVKQAFAVERALLPKASRVPLYQSKAWGDFNPTERDLLLQEAERRRTELLKSASSAK